MAASLGTPSQSHESRHPRCGGFCLCCVQTTQMGMGRVIHSAGKFTFSDFSAPSVIMVLAAPEYLDLLAFVLQFLFLLLSIYLFLPQFWTQNKCSNEIVAEEKAWYDDDCPFPEDPLYLTAQDCCRIHVASVSHASNVFVTTSGLFRPHNDPL